MKKQVFGMIAALFTFAVMLSASASAADAYAILYEDGTLVFQTSDTPESGRAVKSTYEVDFSTVYAYLDNAPWVHEFESVRVVDFAEKISPTSTAFWFYGCSKLERVDNMSNLDTSVTDMQFMFCGCSALTALDLSHFDTANVTDMSSMFYGCSGLTTLDLSHFNTAKVTYMGSMFYGCSGLTALDVSHFDTANVTSMHGMFSGCSNLKTIFASEKFITDSLQWDDWMFYGCTSLVGWNGTAFDESHTNKEYARIDTADEKGYFTYKAAPAPVKYAIADAVIKDGTLSITLTNPDAATVAVPCFDANGKFISLQSRDVPANAGIVTLALSADAKTFCVMLCDTDWRPLCRFAADIQ